MPPPRTKPLFRLLGFPVHVGGGFVIFMLLLAVINGGEFGWWLAGAVAAFTLVHELAHALVARSAGATAEISLEFMAGFTAYSAPKPLPRRWTLAISLAGPVVHIAVGAVVLVALGASPFERPSRLDSDAVAAVWWAGPMIGLFNLIPLLPLDGGHATMTVLDRVIPGKAERVMIYGSVAVTLGFLVATAFVDRLSNFPVFIGFLLLIQLQSLFAYRSRHERNPLDVAVEAWRSGDRQRAGAMLTKAFSRRTPLPALRGKLPSELVEMVALMPQPLPRGNVTNEYLLTTLLIRCGRAREAAEYAAAGFADDEQPLHACGVASAAAALGDGATAAAWLRTALERGFTLDEITPLVRSPSFARVRDHPAIQALVGPGTVPTSTPRPT